MSMFAFGDNETHYERDPIVSEFIVQALDEGVRNNEPWVRAELENNKKLAKTLLWAFLSNNLTRGIEILACDVGYDLRDSDIMVLRYMSSKWTFEDNLNPDGSSMSLEVLRRFYELGGAIIPANNAWIDLIVNPDVLTDLFDIGLDGSTLLQKQSNSIF